MPRQTRSPTSVLLQSTIVAVGYRGDFGVLGQSERTQTPARPTYMVLLDLARTSAIILLEFTAVVSEVLLIFAVLAIAVRGGVALVTALHARYTPVDLRGDWWPQFEQEFQAYAERAPDSDANG